MNRHLPQALELISTWGFTYKTVAFTWAKTTKDGRGYRMGLGYWTRKNTEQCLSATRGHPKRVDRGVRQLIVEPRRREHSRKPDRVREDIERLVGGPYPPVIRLPGATDWYSDDMHRPQRSRLLGVGRAEGLPWESLG